MNVTELKALHLSYYQESFLFTKENMALSGDTMKNYGVRSNVQVSVRYDRNDNYVPHDELAHELYRKNPTKGGLSDSHYFGQDGKLLPGAKPI